MNGEVVGMNTAIASPTPNSGSIGIGFSIVSEDIKAALAQFQAVGNINTAWLGVIVDQADPAAPDLGVVVEQVRPGSPAALAGLKSGDLLLGVDKHVFPKGHGLEALARAIAQHKPGEKLVVLVARQGDTAPFTATLGDDPSAK
jgi:serine protease Do